MNVRELKDLIDGLEDETEVRIVEYGHRSSNQSNIAEGAVFEDDREQDDWGREQESGGETVYLLLGDTLGNRYPPSGLKEEFMTVWV